MDRIILMQPEMKLITILKKIKNNPWVGLTASLVIIIISLYKILDNVSEFNVEYILLVIALPIYVYSLKKIFDEILNRNDDSHE